MMSAASLNGFDKPCAPEHWLQAFGQLLSNDWRSLSSYPSSFASMQLRPDQSSQVKPNSSWKSALSSHTFSSWPDSTRAETGARFLKGDFLAPAASPAVPD